MEMCKLLIQEQNRRCYQLAPKGYFIINLPITACECQYFFHDNKYKFNKAKYAYAKNKKKQIK